MAHLNDLPCGFLRCSSIIVAANSSLFVNNSLFANNTGDAGQSGAMGAAISKREREPAARWLAH
jgi:hypothetical protein